MNMIEAASYMKNDIQVQNILTQYKLRDENKSQQDHREFIELKLGHNSDRHISFPFYNINLTRAQYDKLFFNLEPAVTP